MCFFSCIELFYGAKSALSQFQVEDTEAQRYRLYIIASNCKAKYRNVLYKTLQELNLLTLCDWIHNYVNKQSSRKLSTKQFLFSLGVVKNKKPEFKELNNINKPLTIFSHICFY